MNVTTATTAMSALVPSGKTCGLYYKYFIIVIYDRYDSGQYFKTAITIVIDDPS